MEHIYQICPLLYYLQLLYLCSIRIRPGFKDAKRNRQNLRNLTYENPRPVENCRGQRSMVQAVPPAPQA